jgi:pyridoxal 5'-phosphate synthase pdxT subunit
MRIGVAAVQGAFTEHQDAIAGAAARLHVPASATAVRTLLDLERTDALIIPGGESTAISRLFARNGLHKAIRRRVEQEDYPILGTCAGMVMLARDGDEQVTKTRTELLAIMDFQVNRNAFGRQRESFERRVPLDMEGLEAPDGVEAVFIRAPCATRVWGKARAIAHLDDRIIGVQQGRRIAISFHPELTPDTRVHEAFLRLVGS